MWLKIISNSHLAKHDLTPSSYKQKFNVSHLSAKEVRHGMSERIRATYRRKGKAAPRHRFEPLIKREIIRRLRMMAKQHPDLHMNTLRKLDPNLYHQSQHAFGNWRAAHAAAKLGTKIRYRWSRAKLIYELDRMIRSKQPINAIAVLQNFPELYGSMVYRYRTYTSALKVLGFDSRKHMQRQLDWTPEKAISELRALAVKHGTLSAKNVKESSERLFTQVQRHFRTFERAAEASGIPYEHLHRRWSKKIIRDELRKRSEKRLTLSVAAVLREDSKLVAAARRYYGKWGKALRAAGIRV